MKFIRVLPFLAAGGLWLQAVNVSAAAADSFKVAGVTFKRPATWESVPTASEMRKAQLKVPGADKKESAEVVFFYFGPGGGGGVQANVDRWFNQFEGAKNKKSENVTVGSTKVTYVEVEGTYLSGPPGGAKTALPNHALLGAIVDGAEGAVFIKLTGPTGMAKAAAADFKKMVESGLK
jgi:hypothetical protein